MKLNHKFALLLAGAVLAGSLTGCGASGTPASSAASSEAAASSAVSEAASEPAAEAALPDGVYTADFDTDSSMFHANEANDGKGTLTVKDGQMVDYCIFRNFNYFSRYSLVFWRNLLVSFD